MKIQKINNSNFKGLFTNKSTSDNWRMEYSPYSWESNNTSKMAKKEQFDIYAHTLPDNEEYYIKGSGLAESSKDIFGTESYYVNHDGKMRTTITEMPALNREESLNILNKKLDKFIEIKNTAMSAIKNDAELVKNSTIKSEQRFANYYNDTQTGFFHRENPIQSSCVQMKYEFDNVRNNTVQLYNNLTNYIKLRESYENVKKQHAQNESEIKFLKDLRSKNQLIDISRRNIYDPNKALWEALQDINKSISKFVCLPHKTISIEEILNAVGQKVKSADIPQKAIEYVDTLIKKSI